MHASTLFFLASFFLSFSTFSGPGAAYSLRMVYPTGHPDYWKIDSYRHIGGKARRVVVQVLSDGYDNGEVAVYTDSACQNKVGSTPARQNKVYDPKDSITINFPAPHFIKLDLTTPGKYTFYAQTHLSDGSHSPCSSAKVIYTLSSASPTVFRSPPASPGNVVIASSIKHGSPTIHVHGTNWDWVNLYQDSECLVPLGGKAYGGRVRNGKAHIQVKDLALGSYSIYANATRNKQWSDCSTTHATYQVSLPGPPINVGMRLVAPKPASSLKTPTIEVSGVYVYDVVGLFSDEQCTRQVGTGKSEAGFVRITTQRLETGNYRLYANITRSGATSACSTNYISYTVSGPSAPSVFKFIRPNQTFSTHSRPPVEIEGVQAGDVVRLFSDQQCTRELGQGSSQGSSIQLETKTFPPGDYRLYANLTRDGDTSPCSTEFLALQVLEAIDDSILAPLPAYHHAKFTASPIGFQNLQGPVEWWVSPDGTLWVTRAWSQLEQEVLAKISELENRGADTSAKERELAQIRDRINDQFKLKTSLAIADKLGDPVARELLDQEYHVVMASSGWSDYRKNITITTTKALVEAVEDRYGVRLKYVRENVIRPPTGIQLIRPGTASSRLARPTLEISGVLERGKIAIFSDDQCTRQVASTFVRQRDMASMMNLPPELFLQTGIRFTTEKLSVGDHRLYATTTRDNLVSECSSAFLAYQVLQPVDDSMLAPLPAYNEGIYYGGYSSKKDHPVEWWVRPDGTLWPARFFDELIEQVQANKKYQQSVGGDTSAYDASIREFTKSGKGLLSEGLRVAKKFSDQVSLELMQLEYNALSGQSISVNTTLAAVEAVEERYGVSLPNVRTALSVSGQQQQTVVTPTPTPLPDAPANLRRVRPNRPSSTLRRPLIRVTGVQSGDVVRLFSDSQCSKEVGSATSKAQSIRIKTKRLRPGIYRFYANLTRNGITSACSSANVGYVVLKK